MAQKKKKKKDLKASKKPLCKHTEDALATYFATLNGDISYQNAIAHVLLTKYPDACMPKSWLEQNVEEQERLGIHMVSARLNFGATEYIDHVSLQPEDLYRMLQEREESPKTSQPPVGDFARQYDLLTAHDYQVMSVGLSEALSGTTQAARAAAERCAATAAASSTPSRRWRAEREAGARRRHGGVDHLHADLRGPAPAAVRPAGRGRRGDRVQRYQDQANRHSGQTGRLLVAANGDRVPTEDRSPQHKFTHKDGGQGYQKSW